MARRAFASLAVLAALWPAIAASEPLRKPIEGPKLVCFKYSTFRLLAGEHITEFDGSVESTLIKVSGRHGSYEIGESEILADHAAKKLVYSLGTTKVYRIPESGRAYGIYGPTSFSHGEDRPIINLFGRALHGGARDAEIFERFEVRDPPAVGCQARFTYSWGSVFPNDRANH